MAMPNANDPLGQLKSAEKLDLDTVIIDGVTVLLQATI
jgi:hypothetical protein